MLLLDKVVTNDKNQETLKNPIPCQDSEVTKELIVAEYNQLQAGVLKRMDIRYQMVQFALTALGVFLTIGFTVKNALPIFAYPALALMLSLTYVTNAFEADRMKAYIRDRIEPRVPQTEREEAFGWQHYRKAQSMKHEMKFWHIPSATAGNLAAKCIFIISSFIALGAGLLAIQLYGKDTDLGAGISAMQLYNNFLWGVCVVTAIECFVLFFGVYILRSLYHRGCS
jgi:hypothetical protein